MVEIIVPTPGESITEVEIGSWLVEAGSWVEADQEIASIESEKATLELTAPSAGILEILAHPGETVKVGAVVVGSLQVKNLLQKLLKNKKKK